MAGQEVRDKVAAKAAPGLLGEIHHFDRKRDNSTFVPSQGFGFVHPIPVHLPMDSQDRCGIWLVCASRDSPGSR